MLKDRVVQVENYLKPMHFLVSVVYCLVNYRIYGHWTPLAVPL
jgi:hypothetical protein